MRRHERYCKRTYTADSGRRGATGRLREMDRGACRREAVYTQLGSERRGGSRKPAEATGGGSAVCLTKA